MDPLISFLLHELQLGIIRHNAKVFLDPFSFNIRCGCDEHGWLPVFGQLLSGVPIKDG
jgi:hypothetical protein